MNKQIFLVRHADYTGGGPDPVLSDKGKEHARELGKKIKENLTDGSITIWSSSAKRAQETAEIIKQEMQLANMMIEEKLWSDNKHPHDFPWLKEKINSFTGNVLIIVSHLEYVREFPRELGYQENNAGYAEGVEITNGECTNITYY